MGWPADSPTLNLDHEHFAYAGKFVMSTTGKAIARDGESNEHGNDDGIVAAAAFDADRTDDSCLRVRYVTVRDNLRGRGIGSRVLRFVVARARERGYEEVKPGVNNPLAYEAFYKSGLAYTGERTGLAELVCSTAATRDAETYRSGLEAYRERDLHEREQAFLDERTDASPPAIVTDPGSGADGSTTGDSNPGGA